MNIWFCIPSICPERAARTLPEWKARGYRIAVAIDHDADVDPYLPLVDHIQEVDYIGYGDAVNHLAREVMDHHGADIIVTGGDDHHPDPNHSAAHIAAGFAQRFPDLVGVMQPTGDGFPGNRHAATSPWIGSGFIRSTYGGHGPFHPGYFHFNVDCELREVAIAMDCYWERPDLSHQHDHWSRERGAKRPAHLTRAHSEDPRDKALLLKRRAERYPGAFPL